MAVYRFLFAPALLVVAVLAGSGERAAPEAGAVVVSQPVRATEKSSAQPALDGGVAAKRPPRAVPRAERARVHPVR